MSTHRFSFPDYKKPTWKMYDDPQRNWQELRHQAMHQILTNGRQGVENVKRQAQVSINNNHRCTSCYTCACWSVLSDIAHQAQVKL